MEQANQEVQRKLDMTDLRGDMISSWMDANDDSHSFDNIIEHQKPLPENVSRK